jgi:predicted nucleic acid-binding protein
MKYLFDSNILIYHLKGQLNQPGTNLLAAVIAATAIVHQLTIVTRNTSDFSAIAGLDWLNPFD